MNGIFKKRDKNEKYCLLSMTQCRHIAN